MSWRGKTGTDGRTTLNQTQMTQETRIQKARGQKRGKFTSTNPGASQGCSTYSTTNGASEGKQAGGRGVWSVISVEMGMEREVTVEGRLRVGAGVGEKVREECETEPPREWMTLTAQRR